MSFCEYSCPEQTLWGLCKQTGQMFVCAFTFSFLRIQIFDQIGADFRAERGRLVHQTRVAHGVDVPYLAFGIEHQFHRRFGPRLAFLRQTWRPASQESAEKTKQTAGTKIEKKHVTAKHRSMFIYQITIKFKISFWMQNYANERGRFGDDCCYTGFPWFKDKGTHLRGAAASFISRFLLDERFVFGAFTCRFFFTAARFFCVGKFTPETRPRQITRLAKMFIRWKYTPHAFIKIMFRRARFSQSFFNELFTAIPETL